MNACEHHDPCRNGGACLPTDSEPICDCSGVDFDGEHCTRGESIRVVMTKLFDFVDASAQKDPGEGLPMNDAADIEGFLVGFSSICFLDFFGMRLV